MSYINTNNIGVVYGDWDWGLPSSWNAAHAYDECFIPDGVVMKKPDSPPLTVPKKIIVPNGQRKLILK